MIEDEVLRTVTALNRTWTAGNLGDLSKFIHQNMVAITPMDAQRLEGREACLASWARFVENFKIKDWQEIDPKVFVFGDSAVVTYYYEITFESEGKLQTERGRDMFFMVRDGGLWLAVANQFSSFPG
jgi:ketosteroid isomerase-like protein